MSNSKTKINPFVNTNKMIVGIDIAKHTHVARILFPDGSESSPLGFSNNRQGFETLIQWLDEHKDQRGCDSMIAGLESTGHYWEALGYYLEETAGINVVQVNPKHVKKTKELYDNSPLKTDAKDAGIIAMLIRMGRYQRLVLPRGHFAALRYYGKRREQKVVELGVQRNILHSLVDRVFPEYRGIFKKFESKTSLHLLKHYTTPERIVRAGAKRVSRAIRRASRGKLTGECATTLIAAASATVGVQEGVEAITFAIKGTVHSIERIQGEIAALERELTCVLSKIPYAAKLLSIPGVGEISLSVILGETGDLRHYQKAEELLKLAGLNLYEISSGMHKGMRHISKRGRPLLRKWLYFAALRAVKKNGAFRGDYLRLTETNHMHKTKALVAIARKLLKVLFALARDGVVYQKPVTLRAAA